MLDHTLTEHAGERMRQRGLRDADLKLLLISATQVAPDAYLLTRADAAREIAQRKREIQQLERLRDCKVVVAGGVIVTCYTSCLEDQKRTLRRGRATL
jgi:hypothetical protein